MTRDAKLLAMIKSGHKTLNIKPSTWLSTGDDETQLHVQHLCGRPTVFGLSQIIPPSTISISTIAYILCYVYIFQSAFVLHFTHFEAGNGLLETSLPNAINVPILAHGFTNLIIIDQLLIAKPLNQI